MAGESGAKRRIFVGDVQGCREELERLLEAVRYDPAADALHPVGDLVNRGPDSLGALRLLRSLGSLPVLGNHDLHLLHVRAGKRGPRAGDTFEDVLRAPDADELCAWLTSQPFLRVFDDAYLVHAGLHPAWSDPAAVLAHIDPLAPDAVAVFAVRVRHCGPRGERPKEEPNGARLPAPFKPWYEHYDAGRHGGRTVVFGHWAMQGLVVRPHLRGLDTGCVWGYRLSAWIAEEDRIVDVPAARAYAQLGS
jgi:bis(5'-nucleosyl)-tetraphosphatase (symmetrical)